MAQPGWAAIALTKACILRAPHSPPVLSSSVPFLNRPSELPMTKPKPKAKPRTNAAAQEADPTEDVPPVDSKPVFTVGDWVHHSMFGDGKVESIRDDKLTIKFEDNVTKEIREDFVTRKR
jgi:hypothetical protein